VKNGRISEENRATYLQDWEKFNIVFGRGLFTIDRVLDHVLLEDTGNFLVELKSAYNDAP
jgi:hypothetical protein